MKASWNIVRPGKTGDASVEYNKTDNEFQCAPLIHLEGLLVSQLIQNSAEARTFGYALPIRSASKTGLPISAATIIGCIPFPPPISSDIVPVKSSIRI